MDETREIMESELIDEAVKMLASRLPKTWSVEKQPPSGESDVSDLIVKSPNSGIQVFILVEAKSRASQRDVENMMNGPWKRWRTRMGNQPLLFVAEYLNPRMRELLTQENISYIDLTGNVRIDIANPGIFIETMGAKTDPHSRKSRSNVGGSKAGAVIRVLADAAPPYSGVEIARSAKVDEGYVSRILETLRDEGLIDRESFGPVIRVNWPGLLRRRAQSVDLFRSKRTYRFVARQGGSALIELMKNRMPSGKPPTITGSFAAARSAPIAAPALLVVYTTTPRELSSGLDLLPAETGADVVLIQPDNDVVFERVSREGGIAWAAPSQVAIDCMAGSGRMPSEGEALISWMLEEESRWRFRSIPDFLNEPTIGVT